MSHALSGRPGRPARHRARERALRECLAEATGRLAAAGVPSPAADAAGLAAYVLGLPRGRLALVSAVPADAVARFDELVAARVRRVPLQHLVGSVGFRYLELSVGPGVFVPRPETESVAGWAVDALRAAGPPHPVVVDLCTGSGAIALAVAQEVAGAQVYAVDVDPAALSWTRRNVAKTGLGVVVRHADVRHADIGAGHGVPKGWRAPPVLDALAELRGTVDLVVSNPPYLPDDERTLVDPEVGEFDPPWALWSGPDGLDGLRAVEAAAGVLLRPAGRLVVEHSDRHGGAAPDLLALAGGWEDIIDHDDLAGRPRFVTAVRARGHQHPGE